jgi:hypothetical protein
MRIKRVEGMDHAKTAPFKGSPADAAPSEVGITTDASITTIPCRTLPEAALVAEQLEQADIIPLLSGKPGVD